MLSASTAPLRVLVAEDEPAMLSLVARHLKNQGFSVVEASEGDAAWRLAQEHVPDLIILDVMMPGMSGWEVCRRIKSEASEGKPFSRTGVIMLTGIGENLNDMTSPLFSADAWLNKPFEFGELDERVRETLQRYDRKPGPAQVDAEAAADDEVADGEAEEAAPGPARRRGGAARKTGAKKALARKAGAKKAGAKKAGAKKAGAKKAGAKKAGAKKAGAKKAGAKKTATRKAGAKKGAARKAGAKKAPARKAVAKKAAARKTGAKKASAKKAPTRKASAHKASARKTGAKKAPARRASARGSAKKSRGR